MIVEEIIRRSHHSKFSNVCYKKTYILLFKVDMKVKALILFLFVSGYCENECNRITALSCAFKDITSKLLESNGQVVVMNFAKDSKTTVTFDPTVPFQRSSWDIETLKIRVTESAIITFDTVENFKEFNRKAVLSNLHPKTFQFFVYCIDSRSIGKQLMVVKDTEILRFLYFVVEEQDSIKLMTFAWFTLQQCNLPQLTTVNVFDKRYKKWNSGVMEIEKFKNFEGCPLIFGIPSQGKPSRCDVRRGSVKCDGYNVQIIRDMSKTLNFLIKFVPYNQRTRSYLFDDSPVELLVQQVKTSAILPRSKIVSTLPYVFQDYRIAVPPGEDYTGYEKLLLPFDEFTWIMIAATFLASSLTIVVLNFTSQKFRNLVFGKNVKTPTLNVAAIFFGIAQLKLPSRNFPRFLVMVFILYTLIIRTAWQSKNFEFCQGDFAKPGVTSINQIIQKNYPLYLPDGRLFGGMNLPGR